MKTHQILFSHRGECWTTQHDPVAVYVEGMVDLDQKRDVIQSHDDWRGMQINQYQVAGVNLPDWLSPDEWLRNVIEWKYVWGIPGFDPETPEQIQRAVYAMPIRLRPTIYKLLSTKNFKSEFRRSLAVQVFEWAATPSWERKFKLPLSDRQLESLRISNDRRWERDLYDGRNRGWLFSWQITT